MSAMTMGMLALALSQADRFWSKVDKSGECWRWCGRLNAKGYGRFAISVDDEPNRQKHARAHRLAYEMEHGSVVDPALVVMHKCDNPSCVRPSHLRTGTQAENRADCGMKGRNATGDRHGSRLHPERLARGERHGLNVHPERRARGERNRHAKLSSSDVLRIRARRQRGEPLSRIATDFGVTMVTVSAIATRRTWRHV